MTNEKQTLKRHFAFPVLNFTPALQGLLPPILLGAQGRVHGGGMVSTGRQCGSSAGCGSRQQNSALAWVFHRPQFLWELFICSGVIAGNHVKHNAAGKDGAF